jgi:hypothetical protein
VHHVLHGGIFVPDRFAVDMVIQLDWVHRVQRFLIFKFGFGLGVSLLFT